MSTSSIAKPVPHKHAEAIKAWADGATIQSRNDNSRWQDCFQPAWSDHCEYRVKPEKVYPVTQMTRDELCRHYNSDMGGPVGEAMARVANAALRHAIDADQIITMVDHQDALTTIGRNLRDVEIVRHAALDMAIAVAVRGALNRADISDASLRDIIAGVRP